MFKIKMNMDHAEQRVYTKNESFLLPKQTYIHRIKVQPDPNKGMLPVKSLELASKQHGAI